MSAPLGYRLLLRLLSPALLLYTARQGQRFNEAGYLTARLGHGRRYDARPLWLHAASVGEVNAVLPLLHALREHHPDWPLLLTTTTPSGAQQARRRLPEGVAHDTLPIDLPGAVRRFLARVQPHALLPVETEIWPELYAACNAADVPIVIVNGRLSPRTLSANRWLRGLYAVALGKVRAVLARSAADAENFVALGATAGAVENLGNLKFAGDGGAPPEPLSVGRPYVLAASSRDGEERLIIEAWQKGGRKELLVIAPRHPQRLAAILDDLKALDLRLAVRSRDDQIDNQTDIYLADTFGELRRWMAGAELVFMGGSLVEKGGHNLLEPAALGKAVITGPHMENFVDETRLLREADAVVQVGSLEELATAFACLLEDGGRRSKLGQRAQTVMAEQGAVIEAYIQRLDQLLSGTFDEA